LGGTFPHDMDGRTSGPRDISLVLWLSEQRPSSSLAAISHVSNVITSLQAKLRGGLDYNGGQNVQVSSNMSASSSLLLHGVHCSSTYFSRRLVELLYKTHFRLRQRENVPRRASSTHSQRGRKSKTRVRYCLRQDAFRSKTITSARGSRQDMTALSRRQSP